MNRSQLVRKDFENRFKKTPQLFIAPGRINLIGAHVDYNAGFVMPAAIDLQLTIAMSASTNERCNLYSCDFDEGVTFSIYDLNPGETWVNYLQGVIDAFARRGRRITGLDCTFGGDLPAGTGLSLSAALCCGFAFAINDIFNFGLSRLELAWIGQYAENEFGGVQCSLMDQYASLFGKKKYFLLLDCRQLTHEEIPFELKPYSLLLLNTGIKHTLATLAYNDRRNSCVDGINILKQKYPDVFSLRDVTLSMLNKQKPYFDLDIFNKCSFVINEINRTQRVAELLKKGEINDVGKLMYESHWGLSNDYEVSIQELDFLVRLAEEDKEAVIGARMMGGGFGGCTINIIRQDRAEAFVRNAKKKYEEKFHIQLKEYYVTPSDGIHKL